MISSISLASLKFLNIVFFIFITPHFISTLGLQGYGVWTLIYASFSLVLSLDFGFSNWIRNRIQIDRMSIRDALWLLLKVNLPFAFPILLVVFFSVLSSGDIINVLPYFFISLYLGVNANALKLISFSMGNHFIPEFVVILPRITFYVICIFLSLETIEDLLFYWFFLQFSSVAILLLYVFYLSSDFESVKGSRAYDFNVIEIIKGSSQMFYLQILSALLYSSDRYLISAFINEETLSIFDILTKPFQGGFMIFVAAATPIWYRVASNNKNVSSMTDLKGSFFLRLFFVLLFGYIVLALLSPLTTTYLSSGIIETNFLQSTLVAISFLFSSLNVVVSLILNGLDVIRFQSKVYLFVSVLKLCFLLVFYFFSDVSLFFFLCFSCVSNLVVFFLLASYFRR